MIPELDVTGKFDVICGRLILMYLEDPAAALRCLAARYLAPAGAVAFVEYDFRPALSLPGPALARQLIATMCKLFHAAGCSTELGLRLPQVLGAAGFAAPSLDSLLWTGSADEDVAHDMLPGVLAALRPVAERAGLAGEIDGDLATLPERLRAAVRAEGPFVGPLVVGAAARRA